MKNSSLLHVIFCVCAMLFSMHCSAADDINVDIKGVKTNEGIGYWYVREKTLPVVTVAMAFRNAGALYDPIRKKGLAALSASVLERGTMTKEGVGLADQLHEKGVILNIGADEDNSYVIIKTLSENLGFALSAVGDCLVNANIDRRVFDIEKEHQKADTNSVGSDPEQQASEMLDRIVFGNQPHAYPVNGTPDTVENITFEDVEGYRRENFDLDKVVIGVVGDIGENNLSEILDKSLIKIGRGKNSKVEVEGIPNIGARGYVKHDAPQSVIVFAAKGIARDDPNYYCAKILSKALGGIGLSSVLMQELREKLGITYSVSSFLRHFGGTNMFAGTLFTDSTTAKEGVEAFLKTIEHVKEKGLDERTFNIAKAHVESSFLFSFLKTSSIAQKLVDLQLWGLDIDYVRSHNSRYESVTLQDVNKFAKEFLGDFSIVEAGVKNNIGATITS